MTQPYLTLNQSPTMLDAASRLSNTWAADENTFGPAAIPAVPVTLDAGPNPATSTAAPTATINVTVTPGSVTTAITATAAATAAAVAVHVASGPRATVDVGPPAGAPPVYTVYDVFKSGVLDGLYDLNTAAIKAALVSGYTFDAAHASMADVTAAGGVINGVSDAFTGRAVLPGAIFTADDTSIAAAASGADHYLLVFQASAPSGGGDLAAAGQRLIAFYGTGSGLPVRPGGGTITVAWAHHILQI